GVDGGDRRVAQFPVDASRVDAGSLQLALQGTPELQSPGARILGHLLVGELIAHLERPQHELGSLFWVLAGNAAATVEHCGQVVNARRVAFGCRSAIERDSSD